MLAESIRDELLKVFTVPQADVLSKCVVKAHDTLASRADVHDLRTAMTQLAEQQKLTSAEVRDLAEQQKLTSAEVRDLAEQQKKTSAEVCELSGQVRELSGEVRELSVEVRELAVQQKQTSVELRDLTRTVADLTGSVRRLDIRTNKTAGWALEWVVGNRLPAYVGREIKRCRVVGPMDVIESLEKTISKLLGEGEKADLGFARLGWRVSESVAIAENAISQLPDAYVVASFAPDKKAIKEALKRGEELIGCELVKKNNLQIK